MTSHMQFAAGAAVAALLILPSFGCHAADAPAPVATPVPASTYYLDKAHASLIFHVDHLGFSHWTGHFAKFDATLKLDPKNPQNSTVDATIDPNSLTHDNPPAGFLDMLHGAQWLNAVKFPQITFHSTKVEMTSPNQAHVIGELSMHGITKPVTLDVTFNGGYAQNPYDPGGARVGFSAKGSLERSAFGISYGIPAPGTTMGVGDEVSFEIEAEFSQHPPDHPK